MRSEDKTSISIRKNDNEILLFDSDSDEEIGSVEIPSADPENQWRIRLLDYAWDSGTGFYCLDRNFREETCMICNFHNGSAIYDQIDMVSFVYSKRTQKAAFINEENKSLYIYDDETKKIQKLMTYQAVAFEVRPDFLFMEDELIYVVQSLVGPKHIYIERIDTKLGKVIKRYEVQELKDKDISSISASRQKEIWAAADERGDVYLIDPDEEEIIHILRTGEENIVDVIFINVVGKIGS